MAQVGLSVNARVDEDGLACLEGMNERLNRAMIDGTYDAVDILYAAAFANINKRTGRTAGTIGTDVVPVGNGADGYVGSSDKIAIILEDGSVAHIIRAANGFLRFVGSGGNVIFARQVFHPGTRPYNWLGRAFDSTLGAMEAAYVAKIEEAMVC